MAKPKLKELIAVAEEFNTLYELEGEDAIQTAKVKEDYLVAKFKEAVKLLTPTDVLSETTENVLLALGLIEIAEQEPNTAPPPEELEQEIIEEDDVLEEPETFTDDEGEDTPPVEQGWIKNRKKDDLKKVKGEKLNPPKPPEPKPETPENPFKDNCYAACIALRDFNPKNKKDWAAKVKELRETSGVKHSEVTTKFWMIYIPVVLEVFGVDQAIPAKK